MPLRLSRRGGRPRRGRTEKAIVKALADRSIVLVGLMGAGKTSIGKRLAARLQLKFRDADREIEEAAGKTITEIFADHGESYFREGERKVIERLLNNGPQVLATGGGAFIDENTRASIAESGISVWLNADLDVLLERVSRRSHRPLLHTDDPAAVMRRLIDERYPVYRQADVVVKSRAVPHEVIVDEIIEALRGETIKTSKRGSK